jgi:phage terminase large subunit GpA-like protein
MTATLWVEEREIFRPADRLTVSEWADRYRRLDPVHCSFPGRWRTEFTPYLRGIQDAYSDTLCRDIVLMGSTQWGKTESELNMLLWTPVEDPMPTMFVLPSEEDAKSFASSRLRLAIDYCEPAALRRTADWNNHQIGFEGMWLYMAWSNSPGRLASRSIGRLFMDEVDKYGEFSGKEADPISLASERLRWWQNSRRVLSSTPTTQRGYIWRHWRESDQRWYWVPCPACSAYQPLRFARETVVWGEERDPAEIKARRLAVYVCQHCGEHIRDEQTTKRAMLAQGVWVPEGGRVSKAGKVTGVRLDGEVRGFHVNALYSPMLSWSDVAAQFLRSKDDVRELMNFTNSWLGWPWTEKSAETKADMVRSKVVAVPRSAVPQESLVLVAGVDVQQACLYYSVRAHWWGDQSQTIEYGIAESFEQLAQLLLVRTFPRVRPGGVVDESDRAQIRLINMDSNYRTDEVHAFCLKFADRCRPVRGVDRASVPIQSFRIQRGLDGKPVGILKWQVDTSYFKDKLTRRLHTGLGESGSWSVHAEPTDEFVGHMTSEHRVLTRGKRTKVVAEAWEPRPGGGPNHWWDCEVYCEAAAEMLGLYAIRSEEDAAVARGVRTKVQAAQEEASRSTVSRLSERASPKRGSWIRRKGR